MILSKTVFRKFKGKKRDLVDDFVPLSRIGLGLVKEFKHPYER